MADRAAVITSSSASSSSLATTTTASASAHSSTALSSSPDSAVRAPPTTTTPQPTAMTHQHHHASAPSSSAGDHKFANGSTTPTSSGGGASGSKGKRVFVFQKRWLHSLPIMEKTLPESANDTTKKDDAARQTPSSSSSSPTGSGSVNSSSEASSSRDVIACMLCDEPGSSSHHLTRVWSRMNCRRGRIENHLTSKHPEFMLLLRHKRDSEGDLAVQLFLQGMRDGRCSIRSEISLGLYNHIQSLNAQANADTIAALTGGGSAETAAAAVSAAELASMQQSAKRGFPAANVYTIRDSGFASTTASATNTNNKSLSIFPPLGGASKVTLELLELENRRKRARLTPSAQSSEGSSPSPLSGGQKDQVALSGAAAQTEFQVAAGAGSESAAPVSSSVQSLEATAFAQWQSVFFNKLVVVTGGENEFITSLATNLWLLGASVLLTFTNVSAQAEFTANHLARFPDPDAASSSSAENHRGVMLSMLCSFQTRQHIDEWSKSVADKFSRVDFLINFVDEEDDKKKSSVGSTAQTEQQQVALDPHSEPQQQQQQEEDSGNSAGEYLVSSANRLLELCQSISALCFQSTGAGSIINITTQSDGVRRSMNCAAVESMTKSLALELQPLNVQVNCILLQQISSSDTEQHQQSPPLQQDQLAAQDQQNAALSHTILFLLSPASASVSGSVLRLQHRTNSAHSQPQLTGGDLSNASTSVSPAAQAAEGSAASSLDPASGSAATAASGTTHVDDDRQMLI